MKKCLILHGRGGTSKSNWFPWLKKEMEDKGYEVILPDLPNSNTPNYDEQMNFLQGLNLKLGDGDLIFGHSLGSKLAVSYVEKNRLNGLKIYLVASVYPGLAEELGEVVYKEAYNDIKEYINKENTFEKLGNQYKIFISYDDHFINSEKVKDYLSNLEDTEFVYFEKMGHFNEGSGVTELKELFDY